MEFNKSLEILKILKPKLMLITGKTCSGKSYMTDKLYDTGNFIVLDLDILVRKIGKKYKIGKSPNYEEAFGIYKGKGKAEAINAFKSEIKKVINKADKSLIVTGAISNTDLMKSIFGKDLTIVYLLPNSLNKHYKRILQRYNTDIKNNTVTLPFDLVYDSKEQKKLKKIAKEEIVKSKNRLNDFKKVFENIFIVNV